MSLLPARTWPVEGRQALYRTARSGTDPEISIGRYWAFSIVHGFGFHNDMMPLTDSDQDRIRGIILDWSEVSFDDHKLMVVDGEDKC